MGYLEGKGERFEAEGVALAVEVEEDGEEEVGLRGEVGAGGHEEDEGVGGEEGAGERAERGG